MARLITCGFELNSNTEFNAVADTPTIVSATKRSGTYAGKILTPTSGVARYWELNWAGSNTVIYLRFYLKIVSNPNNGIQILRVLDGSNTVVGSLALNTAGNVSMQRSDGVGIGVGSSSLSDGNWHRVEMLFDKSGAGGSHIMRARVDGTEFTAVTNLTLAANMAKIRIGVNVAGDNASSGEWYYDDIAVNDNSGTVNNSYPGDGKIVAMRPSAAGDSNSFATQVGGTAGSSNNYTRVNETSPDGATSYNASLTANQEDMFNVQDCSVVGIASIDTINSVGIGGQVNCPVQNGCGSTFLQVKKTSGGTTQQGGQWAQTINNTFQTLGAGTAAGAVASQLYSIQSKNDPDGNPWTPSTLDTMQIGYKKADTVANATQISSVFAMVDYTPGVASPEKSYSGDTYLG